MKDLWGKHKVILILLFVMAVAVAALAVLTVCFYFCGDTGGQSMAATLSSILLGAVALLASVVSLWLSSRQGKREEEAKKRDLVIRTLPRLTLAKIKSDVGKLDSSMSYDFLVGSDGYVSQQAPSMVGKDLSFTIHGKSKDHINLSVFFRTGADSNVDRIRISEVCIRTSQRHGFLGMDVSMKNGWSNASLPPGDDKVSETDNGLIKDECVLFFNGTKGKDISYTDFVSEIKKHGIYVLFIIKYEALNAFGVSCGGTVDTRCRYDPKKVKDFTDFRDGYSEMSHCELGEYKLKSKS